MQQLVALTQNHGTSETIQNFKGGKSFSHNPHTRSSVVVPAKIMHPGRRLPENMEARQGGYPLL